VPGATALPSPARRNAAPSRFRHQQRHRRRGRAQAQRQDLVGQPPAEQLGVGSQGPNLSGDRGSREGRRSPRAGQNIDPVRQRRQFVAPAKPEQRGDRSQSFQIGTRGSAREPLPGAENSASRARIVARLAQVPRIAQRRLVLGPSDDRHGGGGAAHGETLAPGAGPGRVGSNQIIKRIQRRTGKKGRLSEIRHRAARQRPAGDSGHSQRDRKGRIQRSIHGGSLFGSCASVYQYDD